MHNQNYIKSWVNKTKIVGEQPSSSAMTFCYKPFFSEDTTPSGKKVKLSTLCKTVAITRVDQLFDFDKTSVCAKKLNNLDSIDFVWKSNKLLPEEYQLSFKLEKNPEEGWVWPEPMNNWPLPVSFLQRYSFVSCLVLCFCSLSLSLSSLPPPSSEHQSLSLSFLPFFHFQVLYLLFS